MTPVEMPKGFTFNIKNQLNTNLKAPLANSAFTGSATMGGKTVSTTDLVPSRTNYVTSSSLTTQLGSYALWPVLPSQGQQLWVVKLLLPQTSHLVLQDI